MLDRAGFSNGVRGTSTAHDGGGPPAVQESFDNGSMPSAGRKGPIRNLYRTMKPHEVHVRYCFSDLAPFCKRSASASDRGLPQDPRARTLGRAGCVSTRDRINLHV